MLRRRIYACWDAATWFSGRKLYWQAVLPCPVLVPTINTTRNREHCSAPLLRVPCVPLVACGSSRYARTGCTCCRALCSCCVSSTGLGLTDFGPSIIAGLRGTDKQIATRTSSDLADCYCIIRNRLGSTMRLVPTKPPPATQPPPYLKGAVPACGGCVCVGHIPDWASPSLVICSKTKLVFYASCL